MEQPTVAIPTDFLGVAGVIDENRDDLLLSLEERFAEEGVEIECPVTVPHGVPQLIKEQNSSDVMVCDILDGRRVIGTLWAVKASATYRPEDKTAVTMEIP